VRPWHTPFTDHAVPFLADCHDCQIAERMKPPVPTPAQRLEVDIGSPAFRDAVTKVFAMPGEDFGPARGYYGGFIDHFIDLLTATLYESKS
jgi:hypothetical protein